MITSAHHECSKPEDMVALQRKWDKRFLELCALVASWSEDTSRQVGAVIVGPSNIVVSTGFNGLPRGVAGNVKERHARENGEKYFWFEHAERNAIYNAAQVGHAVGQCRIYVSLFPCADCARAIIQSGIVQMITPEPTEREKTFARSIAVAREMLIEANVAVRFVDLRSG